MKIMACERGILFSRPMVRAILDGRKTQTRRIVIPLPREGHYLQEMWGKSPDGFEFGERWLWREVGPDYPDASSDDRRCPFGVPGDRLWVREEWHVASFYDHLKPSEVPRGVNVGYADTSIGHGIARGKDRVSLFMPRWASRLSLEIESVRAEPVQDISDADLVSEGFGRHGFVYHMRDDPKRRRRVPFKITSRDAFQDLWDRLHGDGGTASWASNPWVWAITFRRLPS